MNPFTQVGTFNPELTLREIESMPAWRWLDIRRLIPRSPHAATDDIILSWQNLQGPVNDHFTSLNCAWCSIVELFPNTRDLIRDWAPGIIGRVIIARLPPAGIIPEHQDSGPYADNHDRYHFVLSTNLSATNTGRNQTRHLPAGTIWLIDNHNTHSASNAGSENRIHLIVDIRRKQPWQN